jgi:hypothetical protein
MQNARPSQLPYRSRAILRHRANSTSKLTFPRDRRTLGLRSQLNPKGHGCTEGFLTALHGDREHRVESRKEVKARCSLGRRLIDCKALSNGARANLKL